MVAESPTKDHRWRVLAMVATAQLMVILDVTIVNIALPSAQLDLGFSDSQRPWIVTAYALTFGSLLLLGGRLGDLFGRKRTLLIGCVGFALASALGGAAGSFAVLVAARALQGVFGAMLAPAALSTLVATFTDVRERNRAFGIFGTVSVAGSAFGLILGGVITEYLSWRWCMYVNLVFAAVAAGGSALYMRNTSSTHRPRIDYLGAVLATLGLFGLVFGFSRAEAVGWSSVQVWVSLGLGVVVLVAFLLHESITKEPLLRLRVIADRRRASAYFSVGLATAAIFSLYLFLTFFMQGVKGFSPLRSGLAYLPMTACIIVVSNVASVWLLPRFGARRLITGGMLFGAAGMALLSRISPDTSYLTGLVPGLMLFGLAMGSIGAPAMNVATTDVAPQDVGVASALVNTMQQVGGSVGTAILSTIAASSTATYLVLHPDASTAGATHGYGVAFAACAGLYLVGAVVAVSFLPSAAVRVAPAGAIVPPAVVD